MGALVAFETARTLRAAGGPQPVHIAVSGRRAPHLPDRRADMHDLPRDEFRRALASLAGTPPEVLADPELMDFFDDVLRADLRVCETYVHAPDAPLDVPLSVFGGDADPEATIEELDAWRVHTRAFAGVHVYPGSHFYIRDHAGSVAAALIHLVATAATV
jgi:medium-chain acyl-[acyl-carrier-protein] hydrolase